MVHSNGKWTEFLKRYSNHFHHSLHLRPESHSPICTHVYTPICRLVDSLGLSVLPRGASTCGRRKLESNLQHFEHKTTTGTLPHRNTLVFVYISYIGLSRNLFRWCNLKGLHHMHKKTFLKNDKCSHSLFKLVELPQFLLSSALESNTYAYSAGHMFWWRD